MSEDEIAAYKAEQSDLLAQVCSTRCLSKALYLAMKTCPKGLGICCAFCEYCAELLRVLRRGGGRGGRRRPGQRGRVPDLRQLPLAGDPPRRRGSRGDGKCDLVLLQCWLRELQQGHRGMQMQVSLCLPLFLFMHEQTEASSGGMVRARTASRPPSVCSGSGAFACVAPCMGRSAAQKKKTPAWGAPRPRPVVTTPLLSTGSASTHTTQPRAQPMPRTCTTSSRSAPRT